MLKPNSIDIAESNLALFGSDIEKNIKQNAANTEEQWKKTGKSAGLFIWRIEKFQVVPWPAESYGQFYSGDSYIILNSKKKEEGNDALIHHVYFWLGKSTSQDEMGTAAYKTVELDDFLGGAAVQFRETEGNESVGFLALFPKMSVITGGIDSGFKHVEPEKYTPRLIAIKTLTKSKTTIMRQVPTVTASLNAGDVFVLDKGLIIFVWAGPNASPTELQVAGALAR